MRFQGPAHYIDHCRLAPIPALPIPMVAEYLGITPAAVIGRTVRGTLESVEIGRTKLISVRCLLGLKEEFERKVSVVRDDLENLARRGEPCIFYEPIMTALDLSWRVPAHRTEIGGVLGAVSEQTFEEDGLLLSVLVHKKKAGRTMPGTGFFDLARSLGFQWKDDQAFVQEQTDRVLAKFRAQLMVCDN